MIDKKERRRKWEREVWIKAYRTRNPIKHLIWTGRVRAKRRGIEFTITEQDIPIPDICPYLGTPLKANCKLGEPRTNIMTLDRIDNNKGYVPGNVEIISWTANTMKSNASPEQLVAFAKAVLQRYT